MLKCTKFKTHKSGALQGFADIHDSAAKGTHFGCKLFMKDGRRWVQLPQVEFVGKDGQKAYNSPFKFDTKDINNAFSEAAKKAIDQWCSENSEEEKKAPDQADMFGEKEEDFGDVPF